MILSETIMSHTVLLTIEIHDEVTQKQRKLFCEELLNKGFKEVKVPQTKWHMEFKDSLTEKGVVTHVKKDLEEVTKKTGIRRYNVIVSFEKSGLVIFFSGKNRLESR